MKTKNIFRAIFATAFVLGAMAMNAQTQIYVHKTGGTDVTYNIADIDSISLNPKYVAPVNPGDNLLVNPGFEDPADPTASAITGWTIMSMTELTVPADTLEMRALNPFLTTDVKGVSTSGTSASVQRTTTTFWGTTTFINPATLATPFSVPMHNNSQAGRFLPATNAGMYQIVNVTPGKTYAFSAYILFYRQNNNPQGLMKQLLRIKTGDGASTIKSVTLANSSGVVEEGSWMQISGSVMIPADATYNTVRFQLSQLDFMPATLGSRAAGMAIDDCDFHEVQ